MLSDCWDVEDDDIEFDGDERWARLRSSSTRWTASTGTLPANTVPSTLRAFTQPDSFPQPALDRAEAPASTSAGGRIRAPFSTVRNLPTASALFAVARDRGKKKKPNLVVITIWRQDN
ncbi:hypothetical protein Atai01_24540 [Amycolatopsis taiwanensis]|uniref:Uncharacterized protein n=1 Tax=Amycolatopsis taiwanensis TaxID=342230 RepID=A0A9W6QZS4_9PSEU|nr:hypothetical protein Atai01_24540 [Amycolatopsis taiwanensis]